MADEIEDRLLRVEKRLLAIDGKLDAHGFALQALINEAFPDNETRAVMRDRICTLIEEIYGETTGRHPSIHVRLQRGIAEIEELFHRRGEIKGGGEHM